MRLKQLSSYKETLIIREIMKTEGKNIPLNSTDPSGLINSIREDSLSRIEEINDRTQNSISKIKMDFEAEIEEFRIASEIETDKLINSEISRTENRGIIESKKHKRPVSIK